jgi:di/tricarboxylate transporter
VLVFAGLVESVVDLRKVRGLAAASDQSGKLAGAAMHRTLIEAVVSDRNAMLGRSIREGRFRSIYDAAVIAVSRGGETIQKRIGDIVLEAGDVLLLEATPDFVKRNRNRRDFFLVSGVEGSAPTRHERAWLAITLLVGLVALATFSPMGMMGAALVVAAAMVVTRCCTGREARQAVDWSVLLVIGSALGVAAAMEQTGAAAFVAHGLIAVAGDRPMAVLAAVYLATMLFTGFITNNAAAVLMYPIAAAAAGEAGVSFMPFVLAIMFAASNDFATPIGYQTNLMVYGPGGYRFTDYLRFGGPLNLLMFAVFMAIAPWVWPL